MRFMVSTAYCGFERFNTNQFTSAFLRQWPALPRVVVSVPGFLTVIDL
jgi:hypothetical protein